MLYKEIEQQLIQIPPKTKIDLESNEKFLLVPTNNLKVYVYWINEKEKIVASHTMTKSIMVSKKVQLSNPNDSIVEIIKLDLSNQND